MTIQGQLNTEDIIRLIMASRKNIMEAIIMKDITMHLSMEMIMDMMAVVVMAAVVDMVVVVNEI